MNLDETKEWIDKHAKLGDVMPEIKSDSDRRSLNNRTRLSWWFPKIPKDIPVPRTIIIEYTGEDLLCLFDGGKPAEMRKLCDIIEIFGDHVEWPIFLRTDYLSGKHSWKNTCYVSRSDDVESHVRELVTESCIADLHGFPTDIWVARKMIPTTPAFYAFRGEMPIVKERRYFVQDDKVVCHHPYWPMQAFLIGDTYCEFPNWEKLLDEMNVESDSEITLLSGLSSKVGAAIGGSWSIDWLWSEQEGKWYLTDMAEACDSYHWPKCPAVGDIK